MIGALGGVMLVMSLSFDAKAITLAAEDFGIELQNKVTAEALVSVQLLAGDRVEYIYTLKSNALSQQDIINFYVEVGIKVSKTDMVAASSWDVGGCCLGDDAGDFVSWLAGLGNPFIKPGASLAGFKLTVKSLPAVKRFRVQGFTTKDMFRTTDRGGLSDEEEDALGEVQSFSNNGAFGLTIGPDPVPEVIEPSDLMDRLIDLKQQSFSLGGIFGPGAQGIERSLNAKLDAAKKSILKGNSKTAKNQLNAFINELTAQRGKHLTDNAFFLLKVNAEFIISKLNI